MLENCILSSILHPEKAHGQQATEERNDPLLTGRSLKQNQTHLSQPVGLRGQTEGLDQGFFMGTEHGHKDNNWKEKAALSIKQQN